MLKNVSSSFAVVLVALSTLGGCKKMFPSAMAQENEASAQSFPGAVMPTTIPQWISECKKHMRAQTNPIWKEYLKMLDYAGADTCEEAADYISAEKLLNLEMEKILDFDIIVPFQNYTTASINSEIITKENFQKLGKFRKLVRIVITNDPPASMKAWRCPVKTCQFGIGN